MFEIQNVCDTLVLNWVFVWIGFQIQVFVKQELQGFLGYGLEVFKCVNAFMIDGNRQILVDHRTAFIIDDADRIPPAVDAVGGAFDQAAAPWHGDECPEFFLNF